MADYRQECRNPDCTYTGFTGHIPGCYVVEESRRIRNEQNRRKVEEDKAWTEFFDKMEPEKIYLYMEACEAELSRVDKYRVRLDRAQEYLRRKGRMFGYIDWKRNNDRD